MELQSVPLSDLRKKYFALMSGIEAMQADADEIIAEVVRRFGDTLSQRFAASNRESGELLTEIEGINITCTVRKTVAWDSEKLVRLGHTLTDEVRRKLLKLEVKVPERVYASITDAKLLAAVKDARTVTYSQPKIKFTE